MKIKPSIKVSFLITMLLLGAGVSTMYSGLMFHYFIKGLNVATQDIMKQIGNIRTIPDKQPVAGQFYVSEFWNDVPEHIKIKFDSIPTIEEGLAVEAEKTLTGYPTAIFFLMQVKNNYGDKRFVYRVVYNTDPMVKEMENIHIDSINIILMIFVSTIFIFYLFTLFIFRRISRPVEKLGNWAQSLNEKSLDEPQPTFEYKELNQLAELIHKSLNSVKEVLNREHDFLRYASHELRTPIAVMRTNIELLTKMNRVEGASDKQVTVLKRIDRASMTIGHLTEVLLWLGRDDSSELDTQDLDLDKLVSEISAELKYLLNGKPVNVLLTTEAKRLKLPTTVCRIVLANLIRNAYQHTQSGIVDIRQIGDQIIIENTSDEDETNSVQGELGFGLGLQLTQKLIKKFGWQYSSQTTQDERNHVSVVIFS
ncbi:histidine kinase [Shewanella sediminis HAW-EB3]|uniref:histidine kinase n=1 Tax=Shewanella sediminis (strain HAW-EB3) TaxID=425104 RepID=A8FUQ9_SHESH|nr:HAMP domain-containing sensor histidine kinase [Shewanella sediminis]ABV36582.1 histidine kinase [Shewanella sediminis HAW-EB3]